jgi:hypothetical protein
MNKNTASFISLIVVFAIAYGITRLLPYDDTDDQANSKRSGLTLTIDRGTGCHYVGGMFGGVSPRLDANGKQVCRETDRRK